MSPTFEALMAPPRRWRRDVAVSVGPALPVALLFSPVILALSNASPSTPSSDQHLSRGRSPRAWTVPEGVPFGALSRLVLHPTALEPSIAADANRKNEISAKSDYDETVCVATRAVGLNFADVFTVLGYYTAANLVRSSSHEKKKKKQQLAPFVPGIEFSGQILEGGTRYETGDRVFGFTRFGAYSDVVTAKSTTVRKLPDNWSYEEGAAFLVNALTAWHGLVTVGGMPDLLSGEGKRRDDKAFVVVVHSAAGGVGLWASEIAARRGAIVVGVVGSQEKLGTFTERIGTLCPEARCIIRGGAADFGRRLAEAICDARSAAVGGTPPLTGASDSASSAAEVGWGADLVMESYGGPYFRPSLEIINAGGTLATYGSTTYNGSGLGDAIPFLPLVLQYLRRPRIDPGELTQRNIRVGGYNLIFLTEDADALSRALDDCVACLSGNSGGGGNVEVLSQVRPPLVGKTFDFGDGGVEALKALRSGRTVGKVVLRNDDNPSIKVLERIDDM